MHPLKIMLRFWWIVKWFVMRCYQRDTRSLRTCIRRNWNMYNRYCIRERAGTLDNLTGVLILHDNTRPHVAWVARNTIQRLGWATLCHTPYSPDLAPSDNLLFHFLDNHVRGKSFTNEAHVRQALTDKFASPNTSFNARVLKLKTRWQKMLDADGNYFEE
ncbi:UNVERIFIED_CONTAM: Histone-lysine N-methyltransferase SETMAR [Trichonephila clavipes]